MSSKPGNSGPFASARLRLLFVPILIAWALLGVGLGAVQQAQAQAQSRDEDSGGGVQHMVVTLYKSRTLKLPQPFASVVVGSPDLVDALPMSDNRLYIQGKKIGTTNVSVFNQSMQLAGVIDVEVTPDIGNLQEKVRASTGSRAIRVGSSNGQIVLSGTAGNAVAADRAVEVAKSMIPEGVSIVNAMKVAPSQQVMLRVRFLEVARTASREIGVNWFGANNAGNRGFTTGLGTASAGGRPAIGPTQVPPGCGTPPCVDASGNPVSTLPGGLSTGSGPAGLPIFNTAATLLPTISGAAALPFGVALASLATKGGSLDVTLTALETKGLVRRLAEPDLVALSGDTASFLAGGEFPVPTAQTSTGGFPIITTEFKPFGVQLTFVPTVLDGGIINLRLVPSVSELDFTQAVQTSGFLIPSITKREARTTIELRDGQSFAIAGLLQSRNHRDIQQLPWIGSVPVLGALFRSAAYQQLETDLVVIVTPHLVAPSVPGQRLASPLDNYIPTNDVDFFLMGEMEQKKKFRDYITSGGDIQGPYGHMIRSGPALPAISASPISAKN